MNIASAATSFLAALAFGYIVSFTGDRTTHQFGAANK